MASDDDGDMNTRFPCLATVRYAVAAVVGGAVVSLVVMVMIVLRRPEEVQLAVFHGYIILSGFGSISVGSIAAESIAVGSIAGGGLQRDNDTGRSLQRDVNDTGRARVVFRANNPSGRGDAYFHNISGSISADSGSSSSTGVSAPFNLDDFSLPAQTSLTVTQEDVTINNTSRWRYSNLAVEVSASLTFITSGSKKTETNVVFHCWPVTFRIPDYDDFYDTDADTPCIKNATAARLIA